MPYEKSTTGCVGSFIGTIWTRPPANSAERSGEYDLLTCTLSMRPRREQIERHDLLVRLRRRQHRAGERRVAVALAEAADEHVLVVDERQPRDARHRGRGVGVAVRFISCEPMLSVMTGACLRSMSCASADEVSTSMAAAVTVTLP